MKEKLIKLLWAIWVVVIVIFIIQSFKEEISIKHEHEIFGIFIAVFSISLAMILDNEKIKINIHYKNIIQISFVIQVLLFVLLTTNPFNYYKIYYIFNIIILTFSLVLNTIIIITIFENKTISNEFKTLRKKIDALSKKEDSSVQDFENIFTSYFTWIDSNIEKNNKIYMNQIIEYYFKLLKKFYVVVYKSILQNDSSGAIDYSFLNMKIITKILDYIIVNEEVSNFEVIYGGFNELIISFIYTENKEFKNTVRFAYVDVLNYITENKNDWFKYVVKSFFNIFIIVKCDDENKSEVKKRLSFAYKLFFLEIDKNLTYITSKQKNVIMNELISKRDNIINIIGFKEYIKEVIGFYFIENRDLSNISSLITLELILEDLKDFEEFNTVIDILSFSRIKNIRHINIILTIVFSVMYEKFSESQLDVLSKEIEITKVFNLKIVNLNHKSFFENILVSDKFKEYEDLVTDYLFLLNRDAGNYIDFTNELENYIKEYDGKQYKQMYSNLSEIFKISLHLNQTKYEDLVLNSFYHLTKKLLLSLSYKELNIERNDIFKQSIKNYEEIFYNLRQEENKSYLIELILRNRNSEISQEKKDYYDLLIRLSYRSIESGEHKVIRACSNCMGWYLFEELSSVSMRTPLNDLKRMLKETKAFYEHVFNMKNVETTLFVGTVFIINFIKASFKKDNAEKLKREINQVLIKLDIHHLEHLVQSAEIRKKFVYEMFEDKSKSDVDKYTESYIKYLNNQISQKHRQRKK